MRERQLFAHALDRLVEAETGLDADDQQIESVGQAEAGCDAGGASPSGRAAMLGQQVAEPRRPPRPACRLGRTSPALVNSTKSPAASADADAEEQR